MAKDTYHFISPDKSPADLVELFRRFYGSTMNAFEAAEQIGKVDELHIQLVDLAKHRTTAITAAIQSLPPSCESLSTYEEYRNEEPKLRTSR